MANFDLTYINPFGKHFLQGKQEITVRNDIEAEKNAQGVSDASEYLYKNNYNKGFSSSVYVAPIHFNQIFNDKVQKIRKYREMERYPEVSEAIDMVCDDSIVTDAKGEILHLEFNKELKPKDKRLLKKEFNNIINNILKSKDNMWDLFRKFIVEGEQFLELVLDDNKTKIIGVKPLATFSTFPLFEGNRIVGYMQKDMENTDKDIFYPKEQVSYVHWGRYGNDKADIRGYLDPAVVTYNQLKSLEDAVVVYRLVRAPERRVWNIEVGRMPKGKAEEYIKNLIHKHKKQINYNPETGAVDSARNVQSMTEDFYFAKNEGQGTTVDQLPGGQTLGEMEDVKYFMKKLYKVLKLPKNRFEDATAVYNNGMSIEREEVRFGKFIDRAQQRYKKHVLDVFIEQLKIKKYDIKLINRSLYDIKYNKSNFFKDFKEQELTQSKIDLWGNVSPHVVNEDQPQGQFSAEFAWKNICLFTDEDWNENERLRKMELKKIKDSMPEEDFDVRGYDEAGVTMQQQADAQADASVEADKAKNKPDKKPSEPKDDK